MRLVFVPAALSQSGLVRHGTVCSLKNKDTLTRTLVELPCLSDVSFAQSHPLTYRGSDSIHIIARQNCIKEDASVNTHAEKIIKKERKNKSTDRTERILTVQGR